MKIPRHSQSQGFEKARHGIREFSQSGEIPSLEGTGTRALEAWFLGPKAENADELERLIVEAIRDQAFWRRNFHPGDPTHITEEIKRSPEYLQATDSQNLSLGDRSYAGVLGHSDLNGSYPLAKSGTLTQRDFLRFFRFLTWCNR